MTSVAVSGTVKLEVESKNLPGATGQNGWTPLHKGIEHEGKVIFKITDWFGGEGDKPAVNVYLGADGLTAEIEEAVDYIGVVPAILEARDEAVAAAVSGTNALLISSYNQLEVDDLNMSATGKKTLEIGNGTLAKRVTSANADVLALDDSSLDKTLDRKFKLTGYVDSTQDSYVSYRDLEIAFASYRGKTLILTATIDAFKTTNPQIGIGWQTDTNHIAMLYRKDGNVYRYTNHSAGVGPAIIAVGESEAYGVDDVVSMRIIINQAGNSIEISVAKNGLYTDSVTVGITQPTGNLMLGYRGSLDGSDIVLTSYETPSLVGQFRDEISEEVAKMTIASKNILPPLFTQGSYWKVSDGSVFAADDWQRTENLIAVLPNTQYSLVGFDSQFLGNEYSDSATFIKNIAPNVNPPGARYSLLTFTTSATTAFLGLNINSDGGVDSSLSAMLVLGDELPTSFEAFQGVYLDGEKIAGFVPKQTTVEYPNVFFSLNVDGSGGYPKFFIYTKLYSDKNIYSRFIVQREVNAGIRKDLYKISGADLYTYNGTSFTNASIPLLTNTESEFVFKQTGKSDFTGGYHGDEIFTDIKFLVDGVAISLDSNIALTACSKIEYIQKSNMLETDNVIDTVIAIHIKRTEFAKTGYKTWNRLTGVAASILCNITYFGISCITNDIGEVFWDESYNYQTNEDNGAEKLNNVGNREVNYYSTTNSRGAKVTSKITKPSAYDADAVMVVWDVSGTNYNKYYRRLLDKTLVASEVWEGECEVVFL